MSSGELVHCSAEPGETLELQPSAGSGSQTDEDDYEDLVTVKLEVMDEADANQEKPCGSPEQHTDSRIAVKEVNGSQCQTAALAVEKLQGPDEGGSSAVIVKPTIEGSRYQCKHCRDEFRTLKELALHLLESSCENPFPCDSCPKKFRSGVELKNHSRIHAADRRALCNYCGKSFNKYYLPTHVNTHTGARPHTCTLCGMSFACPSTLVLHLKVHRNDRRFQCSLCERRFISSSALAIHTLRHTGNKPYRCLVCDKRFMSNTELKSHTKFHVGERSHKCTQCSKCFTVANQLTTHMRTHTGERPYRCDSCRDKCFRSSRQLQAHIRSRHTGERPFTCDSCGRSFTEKRGLRSHVQLHLKP